MGSEAQDDIQGRAIAWHIRLRHGDDASWEAFADWLAEDPRHAEVYDAVEQADLAIDPLLPAVVFREAANDEDDVAPAEAEPSAPRYRRWAVIGGMAAASVAALLVIAPHFASGRYDVVTGPGEHRIVSLDALTEVALNGSTRITFDRKDPRFAALAEGEALFRVRHDKARPFSLQIGDSRVEDVGTIFNVVRDAGGTRVAVAEGEVVYKSGSGATSLAAGQELVAVAAPGAVRVNRTVITSIGGWRKGHLAYSGAPLSQVAADLGRSLGIHVVVAPAIADRPFSGAITLNGTGSDQLRRLAPALNISLEGGENGWTMKPADGAMP